jgi:hypothetical protein
MLLRNHRERLLPAASTVFSSRTISRLSARPGSPFLRKQSGIIEANVLYHSLLGLASGEKFGTTYPKWPFRPIAIGFRDS